MDKCNLAKDIGKRIKEARKSLGLFQKDFCAQIDMPLPSLRDYEVGKTIPGGEAIAAFLSAGINVNWLLTGIGPMLLKENETVLITKYDPSKAPPLDMELLQYCIEVVESELEKNNLELEPKAKADVIRMMYVFCKVDDKNKQNATLAKILEFAPKSVSNGN